MRIDELHLENFKKFAVQDIDLHPHFTLLVGENGASKTSVLEALAVATGTGIPHDPHHRRRHRQNRRAPTSHKR